MNTCFYCKGEMRDDFCNYMVDLNGHFIIIKHVPCHKCSRCGEVSYSGEVTMRIEEIVTEFKEALTEIVIVEYAPGCSDYRSVQTNFAQQSIDTDRKKDDAYRIFKDKMNTAERSIQEHGYYSEEEVEEELAKI